MKQQKLVKHMSRGEGVQDVLVQFLAMETNEAVDFRITF